MECGAIETTTPKRQVSKQPKRVKSALTPRSAMQMKYMNQANDILSGDSCKLKELLEIPEMQHALKVTGITQEELMSKGKDEFTKERNRAWSVPSEVATMRFKHYEKTRRNNLALLLQVAEEARDNGIGLITTEEPDYERELSHEHKLLEDMIKGRLKYEKILEKEAEKIRAKRDDYITVENGVPKKKSNESYYLELRKQMKAEKCEMNRLKMEHVQKQRALLEETRKVNADARRRFEKSRNESTKKEKVQSMREKRTREEERQKKRQQVLDEAKQADIQRRQHFQDSLDEKEQSMNEKLKQAQYQSMVQKESKRLAIQEREVNVQHIKNVQTFKRNEAARKIQANYRRIDNMNEVKRAIVEERKRMHKLARIRYSHCTHLSNEIRLTPGPGEYNPPLNLRTSGGIWSPLPKNSSDIQQLHATPGPGAYEDLSTMETNMRYNGTTFAKSRLLNTLEMQLGPGPGQYISSVKNSTFNNNTGSAFPNSNVLSPFEISLRRAAESPAPCDYSPNTFPKDLSHSTMEFKRSLHTMKTSYLLASKDKQDIMIDTDINVLEQK